MIDVFFNGGRKVNANLKGFLIQTDQSIAAGGEATAPDPFSLFLASLATCAGVYVQAFCIQRGLPSDNITLNMDYEMDPEKKRVKRFTININVPKDFPEKYDTALVSSAALCTVKRHLKEEIETAINVIR
ncbi:MAG: OsmC family protein [Syntrophothermus sp.]